MRKILMLFVFLTAFSAEAKADTTLKEEVGAAVKDSPEATANGTVTRIPFKKLQEQINMPMKMVAASDDWKKEKEAAKKNKDKAVANPFGPKADATELQFSLKKSDETEDNADKAKLNPFAPMNWDVNKPGKDNADAVKTESEEKSQEKAKGQENPDNSAAANAKEAKQDKPLITRTIIIKSPEEKIRPMVHEDHIYAANSYTCGERKGLKFCENYKGSGLTGEIEQTYGDFVAHEKYRRGYLHGEITFISVDGKLVRRTNYKNGRKHGREFNYHKNGNIDYIVNYDEGVLNGMIEQFALSGQKIGQLVYRRGKLYSRSCWQETQDEVLLKKLEEKNYNELILCPDMDDLSK